MSDLKKITSLFRNLSATDRRMKRMQLALGRIEARQLNSHEVSQFSDNEFQVYSQWGEDGLIQYLIRHVEIDRPVFVEFGVENYTESNTRFLLVNNNWSGLVMDGSEDNISYIKHDEIYWKHNLKAECAFIDRENINELIEKNGISGDIGLLSVDIDGNDYWVWESITCINPRIVVCEYNSVFGSERSVSIPYHPAFNRTAAHYSNLYWGASISAFTSLANSKGYSLVGSNAAGNNLFFVRKDVMNGIKEASVKDVHTVSQFRESRDKGGCLSLLPFDERLSEIADMRLINLRDNKQYSIRELYDL